LLFSEIYSIAWFSLKFLQSDNVTNYEIFAVTLYTYFTQ
jgi:hypothetical protein